MSIRLTVDRLGAQGDGVVDMPRGPVFVPFALPGEVVNAAVVKDRGTVMALLETSPLRVDAACRHFTECGGCAVQHLESQTYLEWKRDKVAEALASRRIEATVAETVPCAPHSRRRVVFSSRRTEAGMLLGYNRALSHTIIDIVECPVSASAIEDFLPELRALAATVCNTSQPFHMTVTATQTGLDVAVEGVGALTEASRRAATDFVLKEKRIARLAADGEIVVEPQKPVVAFGAVQVSPPPGSFLQAVTAAEETMATIVSSHFARARKIADLFAGAGAFALRLAAKSEVHAVEGDQAALSALDRGFRFAQGLRKVTTERRDLFRRPLMFKELNMFDAVVFDPPRAGAEDQSKQIAKSDVPLVAAVSCNPTTLARDLRILIDGGYRLISVTPVDQFLWSPHVEAVALLEKPKRRR